MRSLRIYTISVAAALACAVAVLRISTRIEMRQSQQDMASMREHMERLMSSSGFQGGYVGGSVYGLGIFTVFLAVLVFAAVFYGLYRWQTRVRQFNPARQRARLAPRVRSGPPGTC